MPNPKIDDLEQKPLDPAMELVRRKMVRTLAVSIGVMVIGLIAVAVAIVYKVSARDTTASAHPSASVPADAPKEGRAALPTGFSVEQVALAGDRIVFYGRESDGSHHAFVFDIGLGRVTADVAVGK